MIRRKKGKINSVSKTFDGIKFRSLLELFAYKSLKDVGIKPTYESESWEILPAFTYKGEKIRKITYKADLFFTYRKIQHVWELKGYPNEAWPNRLKLIKRYLMNHLHIQYVILKSKKEITDFINKLIK
jgi:hypothetical protein